MEGLLGAALASATDSLTRRLRVHAQEMGWPRGVAESLTVTADPTTGHLSPQWPDEANDHVLDYEGGSQERAPMPALYKFFDSPEGEKNIRQEMYDHLDELVDDLKKRMFA